MKISLALLATASTVSAFVPKTAKNAAGMRMSEEVETSVEAEEPATPTVVAPTMSQALPFTKCPAVLDGSMAGDVGFDPLGFAKTSEDLINYREAEIKHARLAMLAAAGWPLSELFDKKLASLTGLPAILDKTDRAPSVLNGGLGKISPAYWAVCLLGAAAIDLYGIKKASNEPGYFPGNYQFDPLGMYPKDAEGQKRMQLAEIKNGRLAMIAITGFAIQELATKTGVVDATPSKYHSDFSVSITNTFTVNLNDSVLTQPCFLNDSLLQAHLHRHSRICQLWILYPRVNLPCTERLDKFNLGLTLF